MNFVGVALCVSLSLAWGLGLEVDPHGKNSLIRQKFQEAPTGVRPAKDGAYPHMVSLEAFWEEENLWFCACVGTLVSLNKVLTSASCYTYFRQYHNKWQLVAGRYFRETPRDVEQILDVGTVHLHPNFTNSNKPALPVYDYALVLMEEAFVHSRWVKPVSTAGPDYTILPGEQVTVVGWGLGPDTIPFEMQELNQTVIPRTWCEEVYDTIGYDIPMNLWCAGIPGEIPASDLRGAPVVHNGTLVGICTLPFVVDSPSYPSLHSNVSGLASWIDQLQQY